MSLVNEYFMAETKMWVIQEELIDSILRCIDVDPDDLEKWPCMDFTFDWYDDSFELKHVTVGFELTEDHCYRLKDLGFDRCWLNYTDGTEKYYWLHDRQE